MPTIVELKDRLRRYGLPVSGKKAVLIQRIDKAYFEEFGKRAHRALTKRFAQIWDRAAPRQELTPQIVEARGRRLHEETEAAMRAKAYAKNTKHNRELRQAARNKLVRRQTLADTAKRVFGPLHARGEPLASLIVRDGERLLHELIPRDKEVRGRRVILWKFFRNLNGSITERTMEKVAELGTAFYLRHSYTLRLQHIETGKVMLYHPNPGAAAGSDLLTTQAAARHYLERKEALRLDDQRRPTTKWQFIGYAQVEVKAILTNQPLLGNGLLPKWLRDKKGLYALDTFDDNLCVFRCRAVHQGARPDRSTATAELLASLYWGKHANIKDYPKVPLEDLKKVEKTFQFGIRAYSVSDDDVWTLIKQPAHYNAIGIEPTTIGFYNVGGNNAEHAFLITNIEKLARVYACGHCNQQVTTACNLQRHADRCTKGETEVICKGEEVQRSQSAYEKAFYPVTNASLGSIQWLEYEAKTRGLHIHHALCGHGGERWIADAPVDGYEPTTKTVFQYHGCHWHGCPTHCKLKDARARLRKTRLQETKILEAGYKLVVVWECENPQRLNIPRPEVKTITYPHFLIYDFEAYLDKTKRTQPTRDLTYETEHTPISVSVGDTMERHPTFICDVEPGSLVRQYMQELQRRAAHLRADVEAQFLPADIDLLGKKQRKRIRTWCSQVPVLGFNSGKYDLNLIKQYFAEELADTCKKVCVAAQGTKIMFLTTPEFRFLDIINYLGPGTSYEAWVKAYECQQTKSWLPYEWFDSPDKLAYPGLPDYPAWFSRLKNAYPLTKSEWQDCKRIFRERGMTTFADWLRYYNDLDVGPGIEACQKMKDYYTARKIDMFKDAVSLPGVSLQYLLGGTEGGNLYAPGKEAYKYLKAAVSGGPSIVFTRYHEAGVTRIRSHQNPKAKRCKLIVGYDANALYPSTMLQDMPCGKETVVEIDDPETEAPRVRELVLNGSLFGFVRCKLAVPQNLWKKFEEMPPIFRSAEVPEAAVPPEMMKYLKQTGRKRSSTKKLLGTLAADDILLYTPLLKWYLQRGLELQAVYTIIHYKPKKCLAWFVKEVTEARRQGDTDKAKALLAEVFKLLGNSCYGKLIEALERHTNVSYTKDEKTVDKALRSAWFEDLTEIGNAYEIKSRKPRICIYRPFQVGIAVYQLAKLRMLEFYYDFLDKFVARDDFELIQMDTDSLYFALSATKLEAVIRPELRGEFESCRKEWLSWDTWSGRTPGLFKLEFSGHRAIALCSKCYFVDGQKKSKHSSKGMSARLNNLTWERYKRALGGFKDRAVNRGFRMHNGMMTTYNQEKLGLSAYYDKRRVLPDGIHTEPLEYVLNTDQ